MWTQNRRNLTLFFLFSFSIIITANSSVVFDLIDEWLSTGPYNHGLLGFALALYVFWIKKEELAFPHSRFLNLLPLFAASLLLLVANLASIGQLQILGLFLVIVALLLSLYGIKIINTLFLPLLMIFLILPVWNVLQIPLRDISTWVSFNSVDLLGFEIIRDGYYLLTPEGTFIVEEACSGLGFFLASALYAVFVAQINHLSRKSAALFFILAVLVAIIANWIRITVIIIVGSQTAMQHFIVQDHLTFGWLVFAACFIPLIFIGNIYFGEQIAAKTNEKNAQKKEQRLNISYLSSVVAIVICFSAGTFILSSRYDPEYKFMLPSIPNYTKVGASRTTSHNWKVVSKGATNEEYAHFLQEKELIQVYLANYVRQYQGAEMIFIENSLFDKNRWFKDEQQTIKLAPTSTLKQINLLTLHRNSINSRLIAYWYLIDGHYITDKKMAKWYEVQATLKGQPGATLIAIEFSYNHGNKEQAVKTLTDFVTAFSTQPIHIKKSI
ncbi:eight transmembrane protein EpsH [Psychromonas ingrahamii 37]|uniref:Eight transmembrane protein EpsH n=1 Tax=Psychromonas ingrahamii (strain DSM 17664 / CCUG 51855 / 37) TaxID=357804 RepID=A1SS29_PSYIN|nr:EpsI domain-containing exosortase [Psychromonas ingrahamii]ABM02294.1 eight transmembrane protein EpsH [Psychromonas ingrahamii 37]